jgi:hypothetical protein
MSTKLHTTRTFALGALLTLTACHTLALDVPKHVTPAAAVASSDPKAATTPAAVPTPAPRVAMGLLQKPTGDVRPITGTVLLEANYGVKYGGGTLTANPGGSVLRLGDAGLIANNSGNLIANNAAGIVSDSGGGIVSDNGGGVIANNGGGVIANNGGGLTGKTKFGLLDAAAPGAVPGTNFGTVVPTAGLQLGIVDLTSGKLLALGQDASGVPAYIIITNASGSFSAYVPTTATGSLRLIAVPRDGSDVRLGTALVTSRQDATVQLDEDSAQVASDVRLVLASSIYKAIVAGPEESAQDETLFKLIDAKIADDIKVGFHQVLDSLKKYGVAAMPEARKRAISVRLADIQMGHIKVEEIKAVASLPFLPTTGPQAAEPELALASMTTIMRSVREHISSVMQAKASAGTDPEAYFGSKKFIVDASARDGVSYTIRKPSDFDDFLVRAIFANTTLTLVDNMVILAQIFKDPDVQGSSPQGELLVRSQAGLTISMLKQSYTLGSPILADMLSAIDQLAAPAK